GSGRTITADNGAVDIAGAGGLTVNGSVGIGTTSPGAKLAVTQSGATNADGLRIVNGGTTWNQYSDGGGRLLFESSGGAQVAVQDDGNTGIGTASPGSHRLAVLAGNAAAASASEHISATNGLSGGSLSEVNMGVDAFGGYVQSTNSKPLALNPAGNSVGIGTTNPGQKLTVDGGNFQILSAGNLYLNDAGNTTTGALWNSGGGDINLGLIGNAKMTVKGTGFVGIGTTAPTHTLSFNSVTGTKISLYDDGTAQAKYGFGVEGSELRAAYTGFMSFYSGGYGGTQRMLIDANGRLGIGTASPADLLHVESSNNSASIFGISAAGSVSGGGVENISLRNANSTAGNGSAIMARNSSGAVAGFIGFTNINHNTAATAQGALSLHVADGAGGFIEGIRLSSNGKVGIGTTNPYTRLDIVGDSNGAVRVTNTGADATNKTLNLVLPEYTVANGHLRVIGGYASAADNTVDIGGGYSGYDAATKIRFYTGSALNTDTGTSRMEITAAGNVGIGTASPAAKLDINGDIGFPGNSNVVIGRTAAQTPTPTPLTIRSNIANTGASPNSGAHIILHSGFNAGGSYGQIEYNTQSAGAAGADAGDHIFSTGGTTLTERMRIDFAGNVGIGTASPTSMLHIADNTTPADNEWASIKAFANGNSFIWGHSNTEYDNAIGTLNGGGNPFISFFSYHGATANTLKYSSGSIPPGRFIYSAGGQLYYDTAATGTQDTDIATWNTRLAILNDGKIGIGTTAPSEKLSIEEGHINLNHATIPYMRIQRAGAEHGYIGSAGALFGGTQTDFGVRAESNLIFGTSSTEHMRIASSGNVGIGTSSPGAVLHAFDPITTASTPKTVAILETDNEGAGAGPEMLFKYGAAGSNFLAKIRSDGGPNPFGGSLRFFTEPPGADGTDRLVERLTILDNGNVGIGRIPAANPLEVEGNASKTTAGDWLANSDARLKTDIEEIEGGLDIIARLRPVKFRYSDAYREQHPSVEDRFYYNFIAQEFREIFPESVQDDGTGYLQVDTYSVRPFLVRAVQELNGKVEVLQAENEGLKRSNEELESRVDALAVAVRRLEALTAGLEGDGDGKEILAGTE
ncbi:MAG: hypothetical protein HOC74_43555, partial [Gemmatimonadetes bacterium]|nr:hypothetical protein [Gemmatimonadota bacterium]